MADELTSTGLTIDSFQTRLARVSTSLRSAISPILDISADQPTGQLFRIVVEKIQEAIELLQEAHSAIDPDQATGQSLEAVSSITGTYRQAATHGTVNLTLTFTGAATVPAGSIVAVSGDPDNQWIIDADVVAPGAGNQPGTATASEAGPIQALAGTITVIVTPIANWSAVTNAADAVEGEAEETDAALRLRREIEVVLGGSSSVDSIRAELSQLTGMLSVYVYSNPHWYADAPMPPHSIEAVYWDGGAAAVSTALIAETIFDQKAATDWAYGITYVTHTDSQGNDHQIGMTLADEQRIRVQVDLVQGDDYVGDAAIKADIVAWAANLLIGDDVYRSVISGITINSDPVTGVSGNGVANVTQVLLSVWPAAVGAADVTIGIREVATIAVGDIVVNS